MSMHVKFTTVERSFKIVWFAKAAVVDRDGRVIYATNQADKLWRLKRVYWQLRALFGYRASLKRADQVSPFVKLEPNEPKP